MINEEKRKIGYELLCENAIQRGEVFDPRLKPVPPPTDCKHSNHKPGYGVNDYDDFVNAPVHNCVMYTATPGTINILEDNRRENDILCWNEEECAPEFREAEYTDLILVSVYGTYKWILYSEYMEYYFDK